MSLCRAESEVKGEEEAEERGPFLSQRRVCSRFKRARPFLPRKFPPLMPSLSCASPELNLLSYLFSPSPPSSSSLFWRQIKSFHFRVAKGGGEGSERGPR